MHLFQYDFQVLKLANVSLTYNEFEQKRLPQKKNRNQTKRAQVNDMVAKRYEVNDMVI